MIDEKPGDCPVEIIIGDTCRPLTYAEFRYPPEDEDADEDSGEAYDFTGATAIAKFRSDDGTQTADFVVEFPSPRSLGRIEFYLTPERTALLTECNGKFHLTVTFADGEVRTLLEGIVVVRKRWADA